MGIEQMAKHAKVALISALGVVAVLVAVLVIGQVAGRWHVVELQGASMQPTIPNGSAVLTTPIARAHLKPGDVVTMTGEDGKQVTHRVVSVDEDTNALTTLGDANFVTDPEFTGDVALVRVVVPGAGVALRLYLLLSSNLWVLAAIVLGLLIPHLPHLPRRGTDRLAVSA